MSQSRQLPTAQQIELLDWVASLGAVTAEASALRLGVSIASARGRLAAGVHRGLLVRSRPLTDRPALFVLTRRGLRICDGRGIEPCEVKESNANHLIVCAAAAAALGRSYPHHRVVGERELRRDERESGGPLASSEVGADAEGRSRLHRPDLVLWPTLRGSSLPVAVEVELTLKSYRRLLAICRAWARCRLVSGVLYVAPAKVERALWRAIAEVRAVEQIAVVPLDALLGTYPDRSLVEGSSMPQPVRVSRTVPSTAYLQ